MNDGDKLDDREVERRSDDLLKHMISRAPQPQVIRPRAVARNQKKAASAVQGHDRGKPVPDA